jgi:hypothetical protein
MNSSQNREKEKKKESDLAAEVGGGFYVKYFRSNSGQRPADLTD